MPAPETPTPSNRVPLAAPQRELTLFDSTCIIVGIIVGTAIYLSSPTIAGHAPSLAWLVGFWMFGGVLSLIGAICYAELATTYPSEGGDYVYLTRAFGRPVGFLFAWCQLWIVRPGSIGAMAYAFATYANQIWPQAQGRDAIYVTVAYAAGSIAVMTLINIAGVSEGKWTQNVLTTAKLLGLAAVVMIGLSFVAPTAHAGLPAEPSNKITLAGLGSAMIFVLWAFGGWNEMAFVAAEVKEPRKNIVRALLIGTLAVTALYVLINLAFVHALGLSGARRDTVAEDVVRLGLGPWAGKAMSLLICVSALGAVNGQIFTGSRIYYAMGADHRLYAWLGRWNARRGAPVWSLLLQGAVAIGLAVWFGHDTGQKGFDRMVIFTAPGFWLFLALVAISVMVLRRREPQAVRPYRVPGYPVTPILFALSCGFMVYSGLHYAIHNGSWEAFWSIGVLAVGVLMSFLSK
jgi:basic amino acid/polyamine antiporter, APA family